MRYCKFIVTPDPPLAVRCYGLETASTVQRSSLSRGSKRSISSPPLPRSMQEADLSHEGYRFPEVCFFFEFIGNAAAREISVQTRLGTRWESVGRPVASTRLRKMRVAVIGAGVIGITSAITVKNAFPLFEVHVFADEFSPDTTGDGSAGLWSPYLLGNTPPDKIT